MYRTRDWRRSQSERVIAKRFDIVRNAFRDESYAKYLEQRPHRLSKYNLNCGCTMCQMNKTKREDEFSLEKELESYDMNTKERPEDRNLPR